MLAAAGCGNSTLDLLNPDLGLLAHWAFDEPTAGDAAVDSGGFGLGALPSQNPPTPMRDVPPVRFRDPYSLSFNGQDQWMTVGNPPLLNAGGLISIAAWVRLGSASGFRNVVAHGFRTNPNQELVLRANSGNYEFNYWNNTDHIAVVAVPEGDIGTWTHLCAVFDGATYALYRNGALAASTPDTTAPPPNMETPWTIGGRTPQTDGGEQRPFQGEIDDVRLYGRALTASEVAALYQR